MTDCKSKFAKPLQRAVDLNVHCTWTVQTPVLELYSKLVDRDHISNLKCGDINLLLTLYMSDR